MKKKCVAMLLAGGQGSRLYALTSKIAKPALPFGGKYRIIDFPISNCVNSGIDTVGILTQYRPMELNRHIGGGTPWDLDRSEGGIHILPPYIANGSSGTWYKGTANAIYQNIDFIESYDPDYVLILSGDHIYKMDYSDMLRVHVEKNAACTISVLEVPMEDAPRFGIMNVDDQDLITEFEEKPKQPKSNLASMGIYIFTWSKLREYLLADEADESSENDFGKNIIPAMLNRGEIMAAYRFSGYWKDVGTINSFWDANMDLLSTSVLNLFDQENPIYARPSSAPPQLVGKDAIIEHSVIADGSMVDGRVENSVLFTSCTVEKDALVRYSLILPGAVVRAGAVVEYAIIAENTEIGAGARVGADPSNCPTEDWGIATVGADLSISPGAAIAPKAMISQNVGGAE